ncbi:MAG: hypothetical protein ABI841_06295 [Chloroflexota bacterium]
MTIEPGTGYGVPAWAPPQPIARPRRSGWVTTAAVLLLLVGTLSALGGVLLLVLALALGPAWTDILAAEPGMPEDVNPEAVAGMMTGIFLAFAVIALGWAAGHVAAGVGILAGRGWARITGIVLAVIGLLFSLLLLALTLGSYGMTEAMMQDPQFRDLYGPGYTTDMMGASLVMSLLFVVPWLIGYLIVLVVLIRNGAFFKAS